MIKEKCLFCDNEATHFDFVVKKDNCKDNYIVADVCSKHLSMGLVS